MTSREGAAAAPAAGVCCRETTAPSVPPGIALDWNENSTAAGQQPVEVSVTLTTQHLSMCEPCCMVPSVLR